MKCLDHIDLAAIAGAIASVASAGFLFAWLGVERGPATEPAPAEPRAMLVEHIDRTLAEAMVAPARVEEERARTQEALGRAIVRLQQAQAHLSTWLPDLTAAARAAAAHRRDFLEGRFKLPADWDGPEFARMEREAETLAQPRLGRRIVTESLAIAARHGAAEEQYGRALLAATQALERWEREPAASQQTIAAAAMTAMALGERMGGPMTAGTQAIWPGEGPILPIGLLGAGALLLAVGGGLFAAGSGPSSRRFAAHCETAGKDVEVTVLLSDDTPYEVTRCSAFDGGPVTCGKHCLTWPVAHAA
ncbi:hypothetical protein [Nitrospira sp. Kam-Ns4a]